MPSRNGSEAYGRSLKADIAVLNPETGKMEFPKATMDLRPYDKSKHLQRLADLNETLNYPAYSGNPLSVDDLNALGDLIYSLRLGKYSDAEYQAKERRERLLNAIKDEEGRAKPSEGKGQSYILGIVGSSPERKAELDAIREKSAVKEVIYRGQDAYEVLDSKEAARITAEGRKEAGYKDRTKWTSASGSEGDGLYHTSPEFDYARGYGGGRPTSGVIEGVIDSKHLLDLSSLTADATIWKAQYAPSMKSERAAAERLFGPAYIKGVSVRMRGNDLREYATALVETLKGQYKQSFGKEMPAYVGLGLKASEKKTYTAPEGEPYKALIDRVESEMRYRDVTLMYRTLKLPFIKSVIKDAGFDTIKYKDYGVNEYKPLGTDAYATVNPNQFKSYFGNKKVNPKSPNMFDAD